MRRTCDVRASVGRRDMDTPECAHGPQSGDGWAAPAGANRSRGKRLTMAIGPVQLIVLGFRHPNFHGEIIAELERLRESDTVRVIDSLVVYKDADGELA